MLKKRKRRYSLWMMGDKHILKERRCYPVECLEAWAGWFTGPSRGQWSSIGGISGSQWKQIQILPEEIGANLCPQVFLQLKIISMRIKTKTTKTICENQQKQQTIDFNPMDFHILKLLNRDSAALQMKRLKRSNEEIINRSRKHENMKG